MSSHSLGLLAPPFETLWPLDKVRLHSKQTNSCKEYRLLFWLLHLHPSIKKKQQKTLFFNNTSTKDPGGLLWLLFNFSPDVVLCCEVRYSLCLNLISPLTPPYSYTQTPGWKYKCVQDYVFIRKGLV